MFRYHILFGHPDKFQLDKFLKAKCNQRTTKQTQYCLECLKGKKTRLSFKQMTNSIYSKPQIFLERLHIVTSGTNASQSRAKKNNFMIFTDGFSRFKRYMFDKIMKKLSKQLIVLIKPLQKKFAPYHINQIIYTIRALHTDRGTEFVNQHVPSFCET